MRAELPVVQFVSKPMVEPFRDGSKCLVRDLCLHVSDVVPHVLGVAEPAEALRSRVVSHPVYVESGGFSPALRQNMQVALFLLFQSRADLWHFVFAPNPRSSLVGRSLRRVRRTPTVQTIASPPRSFLRPGNLLFGDHVVAQSEWTKQQFLSAFEEEGRTPPPISVIPPPAPEIGSPSVEAIRDARALVGCEEHEPLFVYPGDLEVSQGAQSVLAIARELEIVLPNAKLAVAYRDKTPRARSLAAELARGTNEKRVRFVCNVPHIHALLSGATAILFPVDDLYGKVDLPIVLLEAFRLGTPVIALNEGPLTSLRGAAHLGPDWKAWARLCGSLAREERRRAELGEGGKQAAREHYAPPKIAEAYGAIYRKLLERR